MLREKITQQPQVLYLAKCLLVHAGKIKIFSKLTTLRDSSKNLWKGILCKKKTKSIRKNGCNKFIGSAQNNNKTNTYVLTVKKKYYRGQKIMNLGT